MELHERISQLEDNRDWQGLVEELEKAAASEPSNAPKALLHLKAGRIYDAKLLSAVKALKHFQDAYKIHPPLVESLRAARAVYWQLGRLNMVVKLGEMELKGAGGDSPEVAATLFELASATYDLGEYENAASLFSRAIAAGVDDDRGARDLVDDLRVEQAGAKSRVEELKSRGESESQPRARARLLLRAARIARRFSIASCDALLEAALRAKPDDIEIGNLYETRAVEQDRLTELSQFQRNLLRATADENARAQLAVLFGKRWLARHQKIDEALPFFEEAFRLRPDDEGALAFLCEYFGKKNGDWERVLALVEAAITEERAAPDSVFLLAQGGVIAWRHVGNMIRARGLFERLGAVAPTHPQLEAFEKQIGERLSERPPAAERPSVGPAAYKPVSSDAEPTATDRRVIELRELAEKQEAGRRYNEYVKTLMQLVAVLDDDREKVRALSKAADVYVNRFANHAEAVKAYEQVLALDAANAEAVDYLRQTYEKRREWEKLRTLERREAERLVDRGTRAARFTSIARLTEERVKKPEVCVEAWLEVLREDSSNAEALAALVALYERTRNYQELARVLEQQGDLSSDHSVRLAALTKLGAVYGDRLNDSEASIRVWRSLLEIDPLDRKAQEALKKKYLALGRWEGLEPFYAESGKWEELIRLLEVQEQKETRSETKVALVFKVAELWLEKRQKSDRAAKAYERVLELEPDGDSARIAVDALIAIYSSARSYKALAASLHTKLRLEESAASRLACASELASLYETKLGDPLQALQQLLTVFELEPEVDERAADLERVAKALGMWGDVREAFQTASRRFEAESDIANAIRISLRLGRVLFTELADVEAARAIYEHALVFEPNSAEVLGALAKVYRQAGRFDDLLRILERDLELQSEPEKRKQVMLEIALINEQETNFESALASYSAILESDPSDRAALAAIDRLYERGANWAACASAIERRIEIEAGQTERLDLKLRLAEILSSRLGDRVAAIGHYRDILVDVPRHEQAVAALESFLSDPLVGADAASMLSPIYEDVGDWARLVRCLNVAAQSCADGDDRLAIDLRLATIYAERLGDVDAAVAAYERALAIRADDRAIWSALEALLSRADRWAALVELLTRQAVESGDAARREELFLRSAQILDERLGRVEQAIEAYRNVLEIDPEHPAALAALESLFAREKRWLDLIANLEVQLGAAEGARRTELMLQIAALQEQVGEADAAVDGYCSVIESDPSNREALSALERLGGDATRAIQIAEFLEPIYRKSGDQAKLVGLALVYEERDKSRAIELYRTVLVNEPAHEGALGALERLATDGDESLAAAAVLEPIFEDSRDWSRLVGLLEAKVSRVGDAFRQVDVLHRIAGYRERQMGDAAGAFDAFARALVIDSENERTFLELERLAAELGRWKSLVAMYDVEIEKATRAPDTAHKAIEFGGRAARVYEVELNDLDSAIRSYRAILELDAADPERAVAIRALDRLYTGAERWDDLANVLVRESECASRDDEAAAFRFRLAELFETRLADPHRAIQAYKDLLSSSPDHPGALAALERFFASGVGALEAELIGVLEPIYRQAGDSEKLFRLCEVQLRLARGDEARAEAYQRLAEVAEVAVGGEARALGVVVQMLREFPFSEQAIAESERLANLVDNGFEILAAGYADMLGAADGSLKVALGKRLASLFEDSIGDISRAREALKRVVAAAPDDRAALAELDRIYVAESAWGELADVLEARLRVEQSGEQGRASAELYVRLGELYEKQLGAAEKAEKVYRKVFDEIDRTHGEAIAALERIYRHSESWRDLATVIERQLEFVTTDESEADLRAELARVRATKLNDVDGAVAEWRGVVELRGEDHEALDALAALYEMSGDWAHLSEILERQAQVAGSDEARVNILTRRARMLSERLANDADAIVDWERVLDIDAANLSALRSIVAIRRRHGGAEELANAIWQVIDRGAPLLDDEEKREALLELSAIYLKELSRPDDAADALRRLLEIEPDQAAMRALEEIYASQERWVDVVETKMNRALALASPEEQIQELLSVADVWRERLHEPESAALALERIRAIDPLHDGAFGELRSIYFAAHEWEKLVELNLSRLEATSDRAARSQLLRSIADLFVDSIGDPNQALEALIAAFVEDVHDRETTQALERVASITKRWDDVIQAASEALDQEKDANSRIRLCLLLAKWYTDDLGRADQAQPFYAQIVAIDPSNVDALRQLAQVHRKKGEWEQLLSSLERALNAASRDDDRKAILVELGELVERQMGQGDQAVGYFHRALEIDGRYVLAIEGLERVYEARGRWRELVDILAKKAELLAGDPQAAGILFRIGYLCESKLADPGRASSFYREAFERDPSNVQAIRGLSHAYAAIGKWHELVIILEKQLEATPFERERRDVLMQLAEIYAEQFLKPEQAARALEEVLELDPTNEEAHSKLERCLTTLQRWNDLVSAYERHLLVATDRATKIQLYLRVAGVYEEQLSALPQAIDAYERAIELDEKQPLALAALSALYERSGDVERAVEVIGRVAELESDPERRVETLWRLGKMLEGELGNQAAARERFEEALAIDPAHQPSLSALRAIAIEGAEFAKAERYLEREQANSPNPRSRAKLLVTLAKLREEYLGDHSGAVWALESALIHDPENNQAASGVVDECIRTESWAKAEGLLELLIRNSAAAERSEQRDLFSKLGRVQRALGRLERAFAAYSSANQLDMADHVAARGLAETAYQLKDWSTALSNFQRILATTPETETVERAELYCKIAAIKSAQDQPKQAIASYERALEIEKGCRAALSGLVQVCAELEDWKRVASYQRLIANEVDDANEKLARLIELSEVWSERERDPHQAIVVLEEARDLQPGDLALQHRLIVLYQETENWSRLLDALQAIADVEKDPVRKSKFLFTMAQIYRDKEGDAARAIELFNAALDINPGYLEAFERINKLLTANKDWKGLERAFRKMLHRASAMPQPDGHLEYTLWHNLGLIYRDRLGEMGSAIEAFKMAARNRATEAVERQILAELYEATGQKEAAAAEHQLLVQQDPHDTAALRNLRRLYERLGNRDRAWCAAAALVHVGDATGEEEQFFEAHRPAGALSISGRVDNEQWIKKLFHKDESIFVGKIFEMITPAATAAKLAQLRAAKQLPVLEARHREDVATSRSAASRTFGWAAHILGVSNPELYAREDLPYGFIAVPSSPAASIAGRAVLVGASAQELAFAAGKHLSGYRGEHYIRNLFPTLGELKVLFYAAIAISDPAFETPGEVGPAVKATAGELTKYLQPLQRDSLRLVVQKFLADGARADLRRWMQATELTACRAGLLLSGDLAAAKRIVSSEPASPGDLSPQDKMSELVAFSVSEPYFELRASLGIK